MEFGIVEFGCCTNSSDLKLEAIPALNRRKMSKVAKFIYTSLDGFALKDYPIVFATNLGEINRCVALLSELSASLLVSPNSFSLSVLNAPLASVCIQKQLHNPLLAISSNAPVESATLSALGKLEKFDRVCVIAYEEFAFQEECFCVSFIMQKGNNTTLHIEPNNKRCENFYSSTQNFIHNKDKGFCFYDGNLCYKWGFYQKKM